jgi:hypothetical protein
MRYWNAGNGGMFASQAWRCWQRWHVSTKTKAFFFVYLILSLDALPAPTRIIGGDAEQQVPFTSNTSVGEVSETSLFARPSETVEALANMIFGTPTRRLVVELEVLTETWEFPLGTKVQFGSLLAGQVYGSGEQATIDMTLMAGYKYKDVAVVLPLASPKELYNFGIVHNGATLKLVDAAATRTQCSGYFYDVPMMSSQLSPAQPQTYVASPFAMGSTA